MTTSHDASLKVRIALRRRPNSNPNPKKLKLQGPKKLKSTCNVQAQNVLNCEHLSTVAGPMLKIHEFHSYPPSRKHKKPWKGSALEPKTLTQKQYSLERDSVQEQTEWVFFGTHAPEQGLASSIFIGGGRV